MARSKNFFENLLFNCIEHLTFIGGVQRRFLNHNLKIKDSFCK